MIASFETQLRRPVRRLWTQAPAYKWTAIGTLASTVVVFVLAVPPPASPPAHKPDEWRAQVPEKKTTYQPVTPKAQPDQGMPQAAVPAPAQEPAPSQAAAPQTYPAPAVGPSPFAAQPAGAPSTAATPPKPLKLKPLDSGTEFIRVERPVEKPPEENFGVIRKQQIRRSFMNTRLNAFLTASALALVLAFPAIAQEHRPAPSPFSPDAAAAQPQQDQSTFVSDTLGGQAGQEKAKPKKIAPLPGSPPVAEAPAADQPASTGTTAQAETDKDKLVEQLQKQLDELKAAKSSGPVGAPTEAKAQEKPAENAVKVTDGWVVQMLHVGNARPGIDTLEALNSDPVAAFEMNAYTFPYDRFRKSTKLPQGQYYAYQAQGFLIVRDGHDGRYVFNSTLSGSDWKKGVMVDMECRTQVRINGQEIVGKIGRLGPNAGESILAVGGVELDPGRYKIEWTNFCPVSKDGFIDKVNLAFAIKSPSDLGPSAPKPGMIVHEVK